MKLKGNAVSLWLPVSRSCWFSQKGQPARALTENGRSFPGVFCHRAVKRNHVVARVQELVPNPQGGCEPTLA